MKRISKRNIKKRRNRDKATIAAVQKPKQVCIIDKALLRQSYSDLLHNPIKTLIRRRRGRLPRRLRTGPRKRKSSTRENIQGISELAIDLNPIDIYTTYTVNNISSY